MKIKIIKTFSFIFLIVYFSACEKLNTVKIKGTALEKKKTDPESVYSDLNFSGITSISNVTDSTLTLSWVKHPQAVAYQIFKIVSEKPIYLKTASASESSISLNDLTPDVLYHLKVRSVDINGATDINTAVLSQRMNLLPEKPTEITLMENPRTSQGINDGPIVRVSGVKKNDIIKLFTDNLCKIEISSATAQDNTVDLITSALENKLYSFYASSINSLGNSSGCSIATANYTKTVCPNDYVLVPFNSNVGTLEDFCIAKYEMRCTGSSCDEDYPFRDSIAASTNAGSPWVNISQTNSIKACSYLNATYGVTNKFALVTNPEWMTIARNIENFDANWSDTEKGQGILNSGWSNIYSTGVANSTGPDCLFNDGLDNCSAVGDFKFKRTHTLSNNNEVWDLAGNVGEWVDWKVTPMNKAYILGTNISINLGWKEFKDLGVNIDMNDDMRPSTWRPQFYGLTASEGLGGYFAGTNNIGGSAIRGGAWLFGRESGIYSLSLTTKSSEFGPDLGFRCVYRP